MPHDQSSADALVQRPGEAPVARAEVEPGREVRWIDALSLGVEGCGFPDPVTPFARLPARAEALVTQRLWQESLAPAGLCVRFQSDAEEISARWTLARPVEHGGGITRTAHSGLDLYARAIGSSSWRFVAAADAWGASASEPGSTASGRLIKKLPSETREFLLHLPVSNPLLSLHVGVPQRASCIALPPRRQGAISWYGTSIVQGYHGSRPGGTQAALLARLLDRPLINLGFGGAARLEPEVAALIADVDAAIYLVDPLPNVDVAQTRERAAAFLRVLRQGLRSRGRGAAPIVLIEDAGHPAAWLRPELADAAKRAAFAAAFAELKTSDAHLHYLDRSIYGISDGEGTVDHVHPDALGFYRAAQALAPAVAKLLG